MIHKAGDFIVYVSADGTKSTLEAVDNTKGRTCHECVGDGVGAVCGNLPLCSTGDTCIVWKEAV